MHLHVTYTCILLLVLYFYHPPENTLFLNSTPKLRLGTFSVIKRVCVSICMRRTELSKRWNEGNSNWVATSPLSS